MARSTYYQYVKDRLGYTPDEIESLGTSFPELWSAYGSGKLLAVINELLDKLGQNTALKSDTKTSTIGLTNRRNEVSQ